MSAERKIARLADKASRKQSKELPPRSQRVNRKNSYWLHCNHAATVAVAGAAK